ncbi:hypothetical protein [Pedococcus bigeumensis]|uniref:hypothetical protein n=1 Tax=Pedococcus bigeumensis TaxID=433644 RepID=UPI002FE76DFE
MNRHLSDRPGEGEQRDPVAEFFARERADIRELPAGAERWESIVVEARRPVRHRWLPYLAGAAAVAVVAGVLWGNGRGPATEQAAGPATSTASASSARVATGTPTVGGPSASSTASSGLTTPSTKGPLPVPASFDLVSMTNAGGKHLYALGRATCPQGMCTAVIGSDDDGATWTTRASFPTLTSPGARSTPDRAHQVVGIRFANAQVGYVFGSATMRTVDGGRTWHAVDVDRRIVLSLETDGKQVWMATARSCLHNVVGGVRGCSDLQPRSGVVTDATTQPVRLDGMPVGGENAWIAMDGSDAYYNVTSTEPVAPWPAVRLSGKPAVLARPRGCDGASGMWVSTTANTRGALLAVCPSAGQPTAAYSLATSTDRGTTWVTRPAPGLGAPTPTGVWLTATDTTHLVAVTHGLAASTGTPEAQTGVLTSADGGASWRAAGLAAGGATDWAGAAGGTLVYAVAGGRSYWVSHDSGATFEQVQLRR